MATCLSLLRQEETAATCLYRAGSFRSAILEFLLLRLAVLVGRRLGHTGAHHRTWLHPAVPILEILVTAGLIVAD